MSSNTLEIMPNCITILLDSIIMLR